MTSILYTPNRWTVDKIKEDLKSSVKCLDESYGDVRKDALKVEKLLEAKFNLQHSIEAIDRLVDQYKGECKS